MTKIYVVKMANRYTGMIEEEYYMNEIKADKKAKKINKIYDNARAKGDGGHWGKVIYRNAWVEIIKAKD